MLSGCASAQEVTGICTHCLSATSCSRGMYPREPGQQVVRATPKASELAPGFLLESDNSIFTGLTVMRADVPAGHSIVARRFIAGFKVERVRVPDGTLELSSLSILALISTVPLGRASPGGSPGDKSPGYYQASLSGLPCKSNRGQRIGIRSQIRRRPEAVAPCARMIPT